MFELSPRLQEDCFVVGDLLLSRVLLMNDARYPWIILVPRICDVREIHDLHETDRQQLLKESCQVAELMEKHFAVDKMNIGVLGNIVAQLHMHHIGRRKDDPAWPGPVWGHSVAVPYDKQQAQNMIDKLRSILKLTPSD